MRILLRKFNNKFYVWKDAKYIDGKYHIIENDESIGVVNQTNIFAIDGDDRSNFVQCNHCGATIKNDQESIDAHFAEEEAKRNCLECVDMVHMGGEKDSVIKYTKNEDGTYHYMKECNTSLGCSYASYRAYENINSERAKERCKYYQCRVKGTSQTNDVFVKYPGLFNKQITIDCLVQNGFMSKRYLGYGSGEWVVSLGLRGNTLHAIVNELGIVDRFWINHRYDRCVAYYSEKYDKLFFEYGDNYGDEMPYFLSKAKHDAAKKIIAKLYKEA